MLSTSVGNDEFSFLIDSRSNLYITSRVQDLTDRKPIDRKRTFGNKGHLRPPAVGEMCFQATGERNGILFTVTVKDILWVIGLPCRVLGPGAIRRDGGKFVDFSAQMSFVVCKKGEQEVDLK